MNDIFDEFDEVLKNKLAENVSPEAKSLASKLMGRLLLAAAEKSEEEDDDWYRYFVMTHRDTFRDVLAKGYQTMLDDGKVEL